MPVIDTRIDAHWANSNWQFIRAANNFARKTDTAVPLECGKQGALSYDRRPFWGNYEQCRRVTAGVIDLSGHYIKWPNGEHLHVNSV